MVALLHISQIVGPASNELRLVVHDQGKTRSSLVLFAHHHAGRWVCREHSSLEVRASLCVNRRCAGTRKHQQHTDQQDERTMFNLVKHGHLPQCAVNPPSMVNELPVTQDASS